MKEHMEKTYSLHAGTGAMSPNNGSARILVPEICQRLALGRRAVYALLEARIIPAMRVGTRWIIGRHAYEEWEKDIGKGNAVAVH